MSEPDSPTRRRGGELHHQSLSQQQLHQSVDEHDEANNSIIGKVRSRVSSIFPQQLTKWFSPSAAAVASSSTSNGGGVSRRRRRNEDDDEERRADNSDNDDNDFDASDNDNSGGEEDAEEYSSPAAAQPPSKRSRLNIEATRTNFKESENLVSSTPTVRGRQRLTHMSLYGKHKEPAYNFGGQSKLTTTTTSTTTNTMRSVVSAKTSTVDSPDIIEVVPDRNALNTSISSRRSLNIPSSSSNESHRMLNDFKRRSMLSVRAPAGASGSSYMSQSASGTIVERNDDDDGNQEDDEPRRSTQTINEGDEDIEVEDDDDNEESEEIAKVTSKKSSFTNGNRIGRSSSVATESGESRSSSVAQTAQPKSGLFNQANRGLRTMSGNGLNFYSHLEGRKSLFSEKNMPGMLNNSTLSLTSLNRRQFNSSIYGSTSALSDSRLLHTSSPFYKGQTTYGGAAAYSKFNRSLNQSIRIAPTLIRPTSSLSTLSSSTNSLAQGNDQANSTAISSTAKRILELINDFSTPLNDAKKMASNIKTPGMLASRNATGKRFSEADLASQRSVRLSSVRKPYTRPAVTLNPTNNDSKKLLPPLKELQVPSMSQLLQMKKMQNCTERSRQIANASKSVLNRECEYKLPGEDDAQKNTDKNANKHVSKIKNKVTASSRVSSKNNHAEDEEPPAPANLPNIAFPFMQSVPKIDIAVSSSLTTTPQQPKTDFKFSSASEAKPTNNFKFGLAKESENSTEKPKSSMNFNFVPSSSSPSVSSSFSSSSNVTSGVEFKFSSPVSVNCTPSKGEIAPINNFKFSSPLMVGQKEVEKDEVVPLSVVPPLKTGSVLDALKKPIEKVTPAPAKVAAAAPIISSFGDQFKKPSNEWECSACMLRNKETLEKCVACETPRAKPAAAVTALPSTNSLTVKNTFGAAFKPKSDTWECSACMVRNKNEANECVACCTKKPGATGSAPTTSAPKLESTDAGFKSLVAQQKASKWECDACMTRNDAERNKCVCCEQAKPGTQVVSESVPQFNFGTSSASKFTFGFGAVSKKEDELKAEAATSSKTENKTGFTFGMPAAKTNDSSVSSTGFSFGIKPQLDTTPAITSKDVPDVVKTNTTTGFKFGVQPAADSSKSDTTTSTTPSTGFSFGLKPAQTAETKAAGSVTFNLPSTTAAESKTPTTAASSAVTSTSAATPATSSPFNPITSSAFGGLKKADETKPAETKGLVFGVPAVASTPSAAIKPITFNAPTEASKMTPKVTFGTPSTASSAVSTSTPSSGFVFGKPAAAATSSAFSPKAPATSAASFSFGKDQSTSGSVSLFGSSPSASSSTSGVTSKSATPVFGATVATPATATVSSSTTGFVFGKPATTSLFGAAAASTSATTATSSVFGSKPAGSLFSSSSAAVTTSSLSMTNPSITSTGLNPSSTTTSSPAAPFVFGSSGGASSSASNTNNKPIFGASTFEAAPSSGLSAAPATTATASSWPTNSFSFGSTKPPEEAKTNAPPAFGSPAAIFGQTTPMFGSNPQQQQIVGEVKPMTAATPSTIPSFGAPSATSTLFGSNASATAGGSAAAGSSNMFGSTSSTPVFGSTMGFEGFGAPAATASAPAAPTIGSNNAAAMPTFGSSSAFSSGFGSLAAASSSGSGDGAPAPKKSDMAFNFGSSAQTSTNSGFSFGGNNNKPASDAVFKFSTSSTPSFNFTGATESTNVAQPFQFGAPTSTPAVFNFGGVEGSNSGGPFQFNAAAPTAATNNIFAPMPTPGLAGSQQAARRKMRTVTRRTQPR
ncbi:nuclear pore complex protein Nup153 isoform X2 [Episyrphus balteatus]|uniref:nuclear pore complex protein Nup153 isoform X2 n=1 Tax=Episyrphus balteatus TaxID=286459 RepID=UPI002485AA81|nr:nuclear pore complex protein Nup153 isoform X2 [Episyrphus balteatus]